MAYEEYFDIDSEDTKPETPPEDLKKEMDKEEEVATEKVVEEKKDDLIEILEDVVLGQRELEGYTREQVVEILKQKKIEEKEFKERAKQEALKSEQSKEVQEQVRILKGAFNPATTRADQFETDEQKERRKSAELYRKVASDQSQRESNRRNFPENKNPKLELPQGKELKDLTPKQREAIFVKAGLVKLQKKYK